MNDFRKSVKPNSCRRAAFHNYRAPGVYMITLSKSPDAPPFSTLAGDPFVPDDPPRAILTSLGELINQMILDLNGKIDFEIPNHVVMPDHVHILWRVKYRLERELGYHIGLFKSRCAKDSGISVFAPKFNDRISFSDEMTERFSRYISDNPRRRRVALLYPHFFNRRQRLRIGNHEYDIYGNFQLLRNPLIAPVIVSSRYTDEERRQNEARWNEAIRSGGVLISPFISQSEKEIMRRGIDEGASIIRIIPDGITPRYKPYGEEFDLCAQGRCLHIGLPKDSAAKIELRRGAALAMNELARRIASNPFELMALLGASSK